MDKDICTQCHFYLGDTIALGRKAHMCSLTNQLVFVTEDRGVQCNESRFLKRGCKDDFSGRNRRFTHL